jgi:hypothetical protein
MALPLLKITAFSDEDQIAAELLYEQVVEALYGAARAQTVVEGVGHLSSINEQEGPSEAPSRSPDTWAVQGRVRLGLRPAA